MKMNPAAEVPLKKETKKPARPSSLLGEGGGKGDSVEDINSKKERNLYLEEREEKKTQRFYHRLVGGGRGDIRPLFELIQKENTTGSGGVEVNDISLTLGRT